MALVQHQEQALAGHLDTICFWWLLTTGQVLMDRCDCLLATGQVTSRVLRRGCRSTSIQEVSFLCSSIARSCTRKYRRNWFRIFEGCFSLVSASFGSYPWLMTVGRPAQTWKRWGAEARYSWTVLTACLLSAAGGSLAPK